MMRFSEALKQYDTIVENGPIGTRLMFDYNFKQGPYMAIRVEEGRNALIEIYRGDIDVAQAQGLPIIINAATYRASRHHLNGADLEAINKECVDFVKTIRDGYPERAMPIFIGAPVGSMYDPYGDIFADVESAKQYHLEQISVLKTINGIDFINVVTIPTFSEALGIALAANEHKLDYTIGFILDKNGLLRDGKSLAEAIHLIDEITTKKPIGYLITCTHASVIAQLDNVNGVLNRFIGVQTNGSNLTPKELNALKIPVADNPEKFKEDMVQLKNKFKLKFLGGCCGTSRDHLHAITTAYTSHNFCQPVNNHSIKLGR